MSEIDLISSADSLLNSLSLLACWGSVGESKCKRNTTLTLNEHYLFYIIGSRIVVLDLSSYIGQVKPTTTLLSTNPSIQEFLSIHSSSNELFIASPANLREECETNIDVAILVLYDLRQISKSRPIAYSNAVPRILRIKRSNSNLSSRHEITRVEFSGDGSLFVTISNDAREGALIFNTGAAITSSVSNNNSCITPFLHIPSESLLTSVSFHPSDNNKFCVTGNDNTFQFWRYSTQTLRTSSINGLTGINKNAFTCHEWIGDNLVVAGDSSGNVTLVQGSDIICVAKNIFKDSPGGDQLEVSKFLVRENLIFCCSFNGVLVLLEYKKVVSSARTGTAAKLVNLGTVKLAFDNRKVKSVDDNFERKAAFIIASICWCSRSRFEVFVFASHSACLFEFQVEEMRAKHPLDVPSLLDSASLNENKFSSTTENRIFKIYPKTVLFTYQETSITSFNISRRSTSFLTFSAASKSIYVRNFLGADEYADRQLVTWCPQFATDESPSSLLQPQSCTLHPTGLFVTIGGIGEVVEYAIADSKLKPLRTINLKSPFYINATGISSKSNSDPHICSQPATIVRYSNGGSMVGIVTGKILRVYNLQKLDYYNIDNTGVPVLVLATADHSSTITEIMFTHDDSEVLSSSADGYVYAWNLSLAKRSAEYCMRGYAAKLLAVGQPPSISTFGRSITSNSTGSYSNCSVVVSLLPNSVESGDVLVNTKDSELTAQLIDSKSKNRYIAVWRTSERADIAHDQRVSSRNSSQGEIHTTSGLSSFPQLIFTEVAAVAASVGWTNDGISRGEICVLGYDDGRIIVSTLPFQLRVISPNIAPALLSTKATVRSYSGKLNSNSLSKSYHNFSENINQGITKDTESVYYSINEAACKTMQLHLGQVTGLDISPSGNYLFSTGADGNIFIFMLYPSLAPMESSRLLSLANNSTSTSDYFMPESRGNEDNCLMLTERSTYFSMKSKLGNLDDIISEVRGEYGLVIESTQRNLNDKLFRLETKMKNEIEKRDAFIVKQKNDFSQLEKQLKQELNEKEFEYKDKFRNLELEYERRLLEEHRHTVAMKQAYDEYLASVKLDVLDREKLKERALNQAAKEKKLLEEEAEKQKQLAQLYVQYTKQRTDEVFDDMEAKQVDERLKLTTELQTLQRALEEQHVLAKSAAKQYQTQIQRYKVELTGKDEQIIKLSSDLAWAKNRITGLGLELEQLQKDLTTSTQCAEKWEEKGKELQHQVNDLEKTRKSLVTQLHELRQEINPQDAKLHRLTEKLSVMEAEYTSLLNQVSDKESQLQHITENNTALQKQLRSLRKQDSHKDLVLRRTSKLFDDYKSLIRHAEGHRKLFKNIQSFSSVDISKPIGKLNTKESPSTNDVSKEGRIVEELDLALGRINDLLEQFFTKEPNEIELQDDEVQQMRNEKERHLHYLHASISGLKTNLDHNRKVTNAEVNRRIQENHSLLVEVNDLRHEIRGMAQDNQRLQATVEFTERRYHRQKQLLVSKTINPLSTVNFKKLSVSDSKVGQKSKDQKTLTVNGKQSDIASNGSYRNTLEPISIPLTDRLSQLN